MTKGGKFPKWFTSYPTFLGELQRLFGPHDPVTYAMNALESLKYKDSTKATRYTLDFNRHSRRTGWNEMALTRVYYKGLPDRLKDEIARIGKPSRLTDLQELIATLDQRYWERQSEISRDKKPSSSNQSKAPETRSDTRPDNRANGSQAGSSKSNGQQQSKKDQKKPASSSSSSSSSKPANKTNSISDVLGPDGKLKPEERQRRMDNKLCLRCGGAGHVVHNCPHSKPKPKGRAAAVTNNAASAKTPAAAPESGKA